MELLTIKQASIWASHYIKRNVTDSNISYLVQYGKVRKFTDNGSLYVSKEDLLHYYNSQVGKTEIEWKKKLGDDLNWALSFDNYKESERTKHVHRLHPYKGKFIPQLVEYFLDDHTDDFKKDVYFNKGDIILDPFCGSGTTLIQSNELGMHAIGIDISAFNALISNTKIYKYDLYDIHAVVNDLSKELNKFLADKHILDFDNSLLKALADFNGKYYPTPEFRYRVNRGLVNEKQYGYEKAKEFLPVFNRLIEKFGIELDQSKNEGFLDRWFLKSVRDEIDFVFELVKQIQNPKTKIISSIILSRTIRSCRATTHSDLATLIDPIKTTYYCTKHKKVCKPLFSIKKWWNKYSKDTIQRLHEFSKLKTETYQICLTGDSRNLDLFPELEKKNKALAELSRHQKIRGIFTSPPYVGLINYHEQHAYAYDLFGFERKDDKEIGPLFKGSGMEARMSYVEGISRVLVNCKKYMVKDYDVFLVANDKHNLYPTIAEKAGMKIVNRFRRPVLNRTEKDKGAYAETIFHLKGDKK